MSTTAEWLAKILSSKEELHHWLKRQWIGEVGAYYRITNVARKYYLNQELPIGAFDTLQNIAEQEMNHAGWVRDLLETRGLLGQSDIPSGEEKYWKPILGSMESFEEIAAAGHHAEAMRLVRIRALCECEGIDEDIRNVFKRILPEEVFHEAAFKRLSSPEALEKMSGKHQEGLRLLGLEI